MGYNEQKLLESDHGRLVKFCRRYVDNIFCLFANEHQTLTFVVFWTYNTLIQTSLQNKGIWNNFHFWLFSSVYRKSTLTWFLKNYNSFVPFTYKKGLIKTPINRTFRLNNTCDGFHLELEKLRVILQKKLIPI